MCCISEMEIHLQLISAIFLPFIKSSLLVLCCALLIGHFWPITFVFIPTFTYSLRFSSGLWVTEKILLSYFNLHSAIDLAFLFCVQDDHWTKSVQMPCLLTFEECIPSLLNTDQPTIGLTLSQTCPISPLALLLLSIDKRPLH